MIQNVNGLSLKKIGISRMNWENICLLSPTAYARERYIRIGSGKENLRKFPEKESYLFNILYGIIERIGPNKSGYWKIVNVDNLKGEDFWCNAMPTHCKFIILLQQKGWGGNVIESKSVHDFKNCSCGSSSVDGVLEYLRRVADDKENHVEL